MIGAEWNRETTEAVEDLIHRIPQHAAKKVEFKDFDKLPEAVAKYLRHSLKEGQPTIDAVRITQSGFFRAGCWTPFRAEQYFSTDPPAFIWSASVRMAHLFPVKVRDAYVEGKGSMLGKIFGIVPFIQQENAREINIAALQRYLAECAWFPTALLQSDRLTWSELGSNSAMATLMDRGIEASLEFEFNEIGEITSVFTPARYRYEDGRFHLTPWTGYFRNYEQLHGVRIPMEAEVEWILPKGRYPYFKGSIREVEFNGDVFHRFAPNCACEAGNQT